jgi:hypothetical protein
VREPPLDISLFDRLTATGLYRARCSLMYLAVQRGVYSEDVLRMIQSGEISERKICRILHRRLVKTPRSLYRSDLLYLKSKDKGKR